jgi:proline iminopeptidase
MKDDVYKYPPIEPYRAGHLDVDSLHSIYFEESGNPLGVPVIDLHGGPGAGSIPAYRRFFDPARYRIILSDQRGCGRSTPLEELRENTTWHLVADLEQLRQHLGIERWIVTGWSWGTTVALAYAQRHPDRVLALVLRGTWTARQEEAEWFQVGMQNFFPDTLDRLEVELPGAGREDMLGIFQARVLDASLPRDQREEAARVLSAYELYGCYLEATDEQIRRELDSGSQLAGALIGAHYWEHRWFLEEGQLWRDLARITHLPCTLVHGRYDAVSFPRTSYELHRAWPGSELIITPRSGHMSEEPESARAITRTMDRLADLFAP